MLPIIDHTDQSSKNHFLTESDWDEQRVTDERLCMVKEQCEKHHITDGIVVIFTIVCISKKRMFLRDLFNQR